MTAHPHAEMIKAKADNMELVVFYLHKSGNWRITDTGKDIPWFCPDIEHFLCLPKHGKACLHWLNGGESQTSIDGGHWLSCDVPHEWNKCQLFWYLNNNAESRIKPKKEKRWIAVSKEKCKAEPYLLTGIDDFHEHGFDELHHSMHKIEVEV